MVFATSNTHDEVNSFQGKVVFTLTKNPANNLTIWVNGKPTNTKTDGQGKFLLKSNQEINTIAFTNNFFADSVAPFPIDVKRDNGTTFYIRE